MTETNDYPRRLSGWKEIAACLGRSVRTAQRWERTLGLPVRRIRTQSEGEIVFAFAAEVEEWLAARSVKTEAVDSTPSPDHALAATGRATPSRAWTRFAIRGVGLLTLLFAATWILRPAAGPAAGWTVGADALRVVDAQGHRLWEHYFGFALLRDAYAHAGPGRRLVAIEDIDGDGAAEVLFVARASSLDQCSLYCFNGDGTVRFRHIPDTPGRFGGVTFLPPFPTLGVATSGSAGGTRAIWIFAVHHREAPALVEKLDPVSGAVLGRYWSSGRVHGLFPGRYRSQDVVYVAGTLQASSDATLAVLRADSPSGCSPATSRVDACEGSSAKPLAFFVFPQPEFWRVTRHRAFVDQVVSEGNDTVVRISGQFGPWEDPAANCAVYYRLDEHGNIADVEVSDSWISTHASFEREGLLDHAFAEREREDLRNVMVWSMGHFAPASPGDALPSGPMR